jgi:competence protein ComEC
MMKFNFKSDEFFAAQRENAILWAPVFLGLGICAYFGLRFEPSWSTVFLLLAIPGLGWATLRKTGYRPEFSLLIGLIFIAALGFAVSKVRTLHLDHVVLQRNIHVTMIEGTIQSVELLEKGKGARVLLKDLVIERLDKARTPDQIRVTIRRDEGIEPGQRIRFLGGLNPPSMPVAPGSYDFERDAYFKNIGAFGFSFKTPEIVEPAKRRNGFTQVLQRYRAMLGRKAETEVSDPESSVVIALLNGDQRALPEETWNDVRIAGLAHIIAISGTNISMAAGMAFFLSRFLMALFPRFALYHPIKVYAAAIAFIAALSYALIVGLNVPTFRALVMTGLVLLAIAVNRSPFSLRMAAVSAFGLLLFFPEFLLGASFQMSFAAVVGLIVFYDLTRNFWTGLYRRANWLGRIFVYLGGIMAVTILATLVTAPFSLANFQQFSTYGVVANAIVVPVVDFWIMPLAIVVYFLAPFGLENWPLQGMEAGVHFMLSVSHMIAGWPYSQLHGSIWPTGALGLMVAGILYTIIWSGRARWLGLFALFPAMAMVMHHQPPDILVSSSAKLVMIRANDGIALLSTKRSEKFSAEIWQKESGVDPEMSLVWPDEGVLDKGNVRLSCEADGCLASIKGAKIAFSFNQRTLLQDCAMATIVISTNPTGHIQCAAPVFIDKWDLKDLGTHAIWINNNHAIIRTVAGEQGNRPWVLKEEY